MLDNKQGWGSGGEWRVARFSEKVLNDPKQESYAPITRHHSHVFIERA